MSTILDVGFRYQFGVHTPTVLVGFAPNDWNARDKFAAALSSQPPSAQEGVRAETAIKLLREAFRDMEAIGLPVPESASLLGYFINRLNSALAGQAKSAAPVEPAAYRYKDVRGNWRYVGTPLTEGWALPANLSFEPLYATPAAAIPEAPAQTEARARQLLAEAYEEVQGEGPYPTYAALARSGKGDFTLCSIRAIQRALATPAQQDTNPHLPGDDNTKEKAS